MDSMFWMTGKDGKPVNYDSEKCIHYGVIHQYKLHQDALDDIYQSTDIHFESAITNIQELVANIIKDFDVPELNDGGTKQALAVELTGNLRNECDSDFSDGLVDAILDEDTTEARLVAAKMYIDDEFGQYYEDNEPSYWYDRDGYQIRLNTGDGDMFVIKSPYYTMCRECSPCAPNAGYLTDRGGGMKTYCLGVEWFEDEKAPYDVYRVDDDEQVYTYAEESDEEEA